MQGMKTLAQRPLVLGVLLFLAVAGVFIPAVSHGFITYDDPVYVTENAHVKAGLTASGIAWAFTSKEASNWHPLTWISHMADCQLYGLQPWGHHLTSVLLHALNASLLFAALRRMTGSVWRSLFAAALFGLHPLHVESVAWISERKDVLSTAFWMLCLWAYAIRAEREKAGRPGATAYYLIALGFFALGLMAKPMLVTLPCVLLLLDFWPLRRWQGAASGARWALIAEKIPFFILGAAACAMTLSAQGGGGTMGSAEQFPMPVRVSNALLSYCRYLGKCFFPARLAVFYPFFAEQPPLWVTVLAATFLVVVTAAVLAAGRRRPYLPVGWLWYAGTLVPVIGLIQIGGQAMADRYTYIPLVGIFIMLSWGAADLVAQLHVSTRAAASAATVVLLGLSALTCRQLGFWSDGVVLFRHAAAVTENNWVAHANLYASLARSSSPAARGELQETLRILASFSEVHQRKGAELEKVPGRADDAIKEYRMAVSIMPDMAGPHVSLGSALARIPGRLAEGIEEFRTATRLDPDLAEARYDLGTALAGSPGNQAEAVAEFEDVVRINPGNFAAHYNLGYLLAKTDAAASIDHYEAAARLRPDSFQAQFNLGLALADVPGRKDEAVSHLQAALAANPGLTQARNLIARLNAESQ
jgi:tetratricopeptide (TPR) repeat protein